ncbi:hypothetical protein [Georgenia deserti]|uniref:DUF3137 domain-containing protein n=1 Tax=Georgenia deserti TaxID=2093781 RepID=A0ABW4L7W3_9MICO
MEGVITLVLNVVFVGAVVAVVLIVLTRLRTQTRKRRTALRAWANAHGWVYSDSAPGLGEGLQGGPFGRGYSRSSTEAVWGTYQGRAATSWRYTYRESGSKNRNNTRHHHVLALQLPAVLPPIELSQENFLSRRFGNDIAFENAAFNHEWRVQSPSPRAAYDVLHPRTMERLMRPDLVGANILIEGGRIFLWRYGQPDPSGIAYGLALLTELVDMIPGFVWDNARGHA